jgi:hypothetical protein
MNGYVLSVLGITMAGIIIDIILPSGSINKYIKSIYSIFVVAVLLMPLINFLNNNNGFSFKYNDIELQENLLNYINQKKVDALESNIEEHLFKEGYNSIDIEIHYSIQNNEIVYKNCNVNLKNLEISTDKQHINKYEFIKEVVKDYLNLSYEEIIFDE